MKHIDIDVGFTYAPSQIMSNTTVVAGENEATEVIATYHENLLADIGGAYEEWCDIEYVDPSTKKMVKNVVELDGNHSFVLTDIITYGRKFSLQFWARFGEVEYRDSSIFAFTAEPSINAIANELLPERNIYQAMVLPVLNNKVDKVAGKGLSTNDYTNEEKEKLAGIGIGDVLTVTQNEKEKITSIDSISSELADNMQQIALKADKTYVDTKFGNMGNTKTYKGSCTFAQLPTTGMEVDDYWYIIDQNTNRCWNGSTWGDIGNNLKVGDNTVSVNLLAENIRNALGMETYKNLAYDLLTGNNIFRITPTSALYGIRYYGRYSNHFSLKANKRYLIIFKGELNADNLQTNFGVTTIFQKVSDLTNFGTLSVNVAFTSGQISLGNYYGYSVIDVAEDAEACIYMFATGLTVGNLFSLTIAKLGVFELDTEDDYNYYITLFKNNEYTDYYSITTNIPEKIAEIEGIGADVSSIKEQLSYENTIICWGDSLTNGAGGNGVHYPLILSQLTGKTVLNFGVGGEDGNTIMGRQGSLPMLVQPVNILADTTAVEITLKSANGGTVYPLHQSGRDENINPCYIGSIEGTLTYDSINDKYNFTRSTAGYLYSVTRPTPLRTLAMQNYKQGILCLWVGTNDVKSDTVLNSDFFNTLISHYKLMIEYAKCEKYIMLSMVEGVESKWDLYNKMMFDTFGRHYINIHNYLVNYGLADTGITPTSQDIADISICRVPTSLRSDGLHLNNYGYTVIGQQVYKRGQELGYWS